MDFLKELCIYDIQTTKGLGGLKVSHIFADSIVNYRSIVYFSRRGFEGWGSQSWSFFVDVTNVQPLKPIFYYVIEVVF